LIEEYSCEKKPDDGEIYRKIREYQGYGGGGNPYFESRWWALLHGISSHKSDNMKQIIRNPDFRAAFDIQLDVPGLGGGMSLGSTHKVFGMKCHEVRFPLDDYVDVLTFQLMLSYLDDNIRGFWTKIFQGDRQAMLKVSRADVKALELKAPGACRSDRLSLHGQLRDGKIFGAFTEREREAIWTDILSETTDCLIPSLSSFFADVHYLKGPADCVKALVELWPDETVSSALERIFSDANQETDRCIIQQSESNFISIPGNKSDRLELGVLQIWISAMRDYLEMPPDNDDDTLVAKPRSQPHERIAYGFASLAYRLGFESEEIRNQIQRSPDEEIARKALLKARDPTRYKYDDTAFANFVEQMVRFFSTAEKREDETMMDFECYPKTLKRKGIPQTGIYKADKSSLFLEKLHSIREDQSDEVTSFFVRRSVYFAFFGKPDRATRERLERLIREEQGGLTEQNREEQEQWRARVAREEQGRLDQEKREEQERQKLEQERQEKEKQEKERQEKEKQEKERQRLEQERQEKESQRLEQERQEKERQRLEQERQEKERQRLEQQRQEKERQRLEQERQEKERQRLEQQKQEKEKQEKERKRLEQQKQEKERQEKERQEKERQEKERQEKERLERKRQRLEQDTLEQERLAKREQKRNKKTEERGNQQPDPERGRGDKKQTTSSPAVTQQNRKRATRIDFNKLADTITQQTVENSGSTSVPQLEPPTSQVQGDNERTIPIGDYQDLPVVAGDTSASTSKLKTATQQPVDIHFKIRDHGEYRPLQTLSVDPSDTKELERFVVKYMRKHEPIYTYTKDERMVKVGTCFEDAIADGENTLYLIPKWELNNGSGSNESDSKVAQSAWKILKLS
jgi:hypothetical protein